MNEVTEDSQGVGLGPSSSIVAFRRAPEPQQEPVAYKPIVRPDWGKPADVPSTASAEDVERTVDQQSNQQEPHPYDYRGIAVTEDNRDGLKAFGSIAAKLNLNQDQFREIAQGFQAWEATQRAEMDKFDAAAKDTALKAIREKWGSQTDATISLIRQYIDKLPFGSAIRNARLSDGTPLCSSLEGLSWLADLARRPSRMPTSQSPTSDGDDVTEYRGLLKLMREQRSQYDKDLGAQARMRDLIGALTAQGRLSKNGDLL